MNANTQDSQWAVFSKSRTGPDLLNEESIAHSESAAILKFMAGRSIKKSDWDKAVAAGVYKCKKLPR